MTLLLRDLQCGVFECRDCSIREYRLQFLAPALLRSQPGLDVLGAQIDDASIMACGCHIRWRVIGNGRQTAKNRFLRIGPVRPQTGNEHRLRRVRRKLQHDILFRLAGSELPTLLHVQLHVLIEALDHQDGVVMSELLVPKFLEVVATRIVEPGKFLIVESRLPCGSTGVAHRSQKILSMVFDDYARVDHGENPVVARLRLAASPGRKLLGERGDLIRRDAHVFAGFLGFLRLQRSFCGDQPRLLGEEILFKLTGRARAMLLDGGFNAPRLISGGLIEIGFEAPGDVEHRVVKSPKEKLLRLIVIEPDPQLPIHLASGLDDLSGVAHRRKSTVRRQTPPATNEWRFWPPTCARCLPSWQLAVCQWEGGIPRGFCNCTARMWQRFLPHLEQRRRFSTVWSVASHPHKWAKRLGYVCRSCAHPEHFRYRRYCPNSSDSRVTLKSRAMRGTVYNARYRKPAFSQHINAGGASATS